MQPILKGRGRRGNRRFPCLIEARIRLDSINFSFEHLLDKEKTDLAFNAARQNVSIPYFSQSPHFHVVFSHNEPRCIMDIIGFEEPGLYLFRHIFLILVFLHRISWLEHCLFKLTSCGWRPRRTNKRVSRNYHIIITIRECLGCQFNHFFCFHRKCAVKITRYVVSIQFRIHVGARFQMFCVHCIGGQVVFDRYIYKNGCPTRVFQLCIRVWIIGEKKTIGFGRTSRDFISVIGVRAEKTTVKCNLH
jgi:hypothetical protein